MANVKDTDQIDIMSLLSPEQKKELQDKIRQIESDLLTKYTKERSGSMINEILNAKMDATVDEVVKALHASPNWKFIKTLHFSQVFKTTMAAAIAKKTNPETKEKVYKALKISDEPLSLKQLAQDVDIGTQTVGNALKELQAEKKVQFLGGRRDRKYKIAA